MHEELRQSIYREYLQEVSFLYAHRKMALEDPRFDLAKVAGLEARLEAHLDGLVLGTDEARARCHARAEEGDAGELHAALRVFCRAGEPTDVFRAVAAVDPSEPAVVEAVADALKLELPEHWVPELRKWLADVGTPAPLCTGVAVAAGYLRLPLGADLLSRAMRLPAPEVLPYLWALGQLREASAAMLLLRFMQQPAPEAGRAAGIAVLRLGLPDMRLHLRRAAELSWAAIPLAIDAEEETDGVLAQLALQFPSDDALVALGLLGDGAAVEPLVAALSVPALAPSAALGLYLLTGAPLFPQETDEPLPIPQHILQSAEPWKAWLKKNGVPKAGVRYRLGQPRSAAALARTLFDFRIPLAVRAYVLDEFAVQYGAEVPAGPDVPAAAMARHVAKLRTITPKQEAPCR